MVLIFCLPATGSPYSKPGIPSSNTLLRPLMRYFGDREDMLGANLLKEMKGMFENMTKVFADMKNVCLFQCFSYYSRYADLARRALEDDMENFNYKMELTISHLLTIF